MGVVGDEQHGYGVMEGPSAPSTSEHNRGPKVSGQQDWWVTSMPDPCSAASQVRVVGVGGEVSVDVMEGLYLSFHLSITDGDRPRPEATGKGEGQHADISIPNLPSTSGSRTVTDREPWYLQLGSLAPLLP